MPPPSRLLRAVIISATAGVLLFTGGCRMLPDQDGPVPTAAVSSAGAPSAAPSDPASTAASVPSADDLGPVVATRKGSAGSNHHASEDLTLEVYALVRTGELAMLNFAITNGSADAWPPLHALGGTYGPTGLADVSGVNLVDGKNRKHYLVAKDAEDQCVCSRDLSNVDVPAGGSMIFTATYAAPPADLSAIDVKFPIFGMVHDVPIH